MWLSAATLVVVPATVAEHWRHQLAAHTAPGALRVGQLGQVPRPLAARLPSGGGLTAADVLHTCAVPSIGVLWKVFI